VNWKALLRPEMVIAVCLLLILLGCVTDQTPPPVTTSQAQTKPLACSDFPPIKYNPGNSSATKESIIGIMDAHPDNPLGWARGELGDTLSTRAAISNYAAARRALRCDN
jgi:hypothetical protein